jgi:hypothetical protein
MPSAAVSASNSRYPSAVSVARRKRRIWGSSSMSTTTGSGITRYRNRRRAGQGECEQEGDATFGKVLRPPCACMIPGQIARPRPVPWMHAGGSQILHNQTALLIKGALLFRRNVVLTDVPYLLKR